MKLHRRTWLGAAAAWPLGSLGQPPATGDYKLIVPVEPGGGIDAIARLLSLHWSAELRGAPAVINRSGASGNIGTVSVARAKPDGLTLLVTGTSHIASPALHGNAGYDATEDFTPIARIGTAPLVMLAGDALKGMSLRQILQDARSTSQGFSFGSAGYGHTSHIAGEIFMARTGAKWLHVPYRGNGPATRALLAGDVQLMFLSAPSVAATVATGRAHAVAVVHPERLAILPQVPTAAELGVNDAEYSQWYGVLAPKGTPPETARFLSALAIRTVQDPAFAQQLRSQGAEPDPMAHEPFAQFLAAERTRLEQLLKKERVGAPVN